MTGYGIPPEFRTHCPASLVPHIFNNSAQHCVDPRLPVLAARTEMRDHTRGVPKGHHFLSRHPLRGPAGRAYSLGELGHDLAGAAHSGVILSRLFRIVRVGDNPRIDLGLFFRCRAYMDGTS
jgi:hypothetical protein